MTILLPAVNHFTKTDNGIILKLILRSDTIEADTLPEEFLILLIYRRSFENFQKKASPLQDYSRLKKT